MSADLGKIYRIPSGADTSVLDLPTFDELRGLNRDSFVAALSERFNAVIALAVMREVGGSTQILTGIRTERNETHPLVVSVPTAVCEMYKLARSLDEDRTVRGSDSKTLIFSGVERTFTRTRTCYSTNIGHIATHILGIKLGLGDSVEDLVVQGARFRYQNLRLGTSLIDFDVAADEDIVEAIAMLNIGVVVPAGCCDDLCDTRELRSLTWVDEKDFLGGFYSREATRFFGDKLSARDEPEVCVHGLCLDTTALGIETRQAPVC